MADQQEEETRLMDAPVEMELKRIGFVKDAMKTAEPYYEGLKSKSGPLKVSSVRPCHRSYFGNVHGPHANGRLGVSCNVDGGKRPLVFLRV